MTDDVPPPSAELPEERRHYPRTVGGVLYLLVLLATGVGIGIAWAGDWRLGVKWVGSALGAAGTLRLLLRERDAGMLAVRHRLVDFLLLAGVGITLVVLSESIPNQPL